MLRLGCAGGVAGIARVRRDTPTRHAGQALLFLTVDLCSLCLRADDSSNAMLVSTALFGRRRGRRSAARNTQGRGHGVRTNHRRRRSFLARDRAHHGLEHLGGK